MLLEEVYGRVGDHVGCDLCRTSHQVLRSELVCVLCASSRASLPKFNSPLDITHITGYKKCRASC